MKAPSVIIGVGGIGSEICAMVSKMLPQNTPDRDSYRFVVMDTDVNSIRDLHRNGFRGTEILLSNNITVGKCRKMMGNLVSDWYPVNEIFDNKSMTEGAGQQRSISRLALEYSMREGLLEPLFSDIRELHELTPKESKQKTRFYIISSLAGGTGSGIILPLSLYINQFILEEMGDELAICKGFFILSSALRKSIDSELEQLSLDSNAYATIKEISSFMQLADGDRDRYEDLSISLVNRGNSSKKPDTHSTYEYCFLFGMANERGKRIHSFNELKYLVAKAVYMQACSPIHDRNSTREDNKIKQNNVVMSKHGENHPRRFGGIGCGELIYPYEKLKVYYGLNWAMDTMEEQWKKYDKLYFDKEYEERSKKKQGKKSITVYRSKEYVSAVNLADELDFLAEDIRISCKTSDGRNTWDCYLEALGKLVSMRIKERKQENCTGQEKDENLFSLNMEELCPANRSNGRNRQKIGVLKNVTKDVIKDFQSIKPDILAISEEYGPQLGEMLFSEHSLLEEQPEYHIEHWLVRDGQFIHPNAVRYFLYNLKESLADYKRREKEREKSAEVKYINLSSNQKIPPLTFRRRYFNRIYNSYQNGWDSLYKHEEAKLYLDILEQCEKHVDSLIQAYEMFYDSYDELLIKFKEKSEEIGQEFDTVKGITRSFVCADKVCRKKMMEKLKRDGRFVRANSNLSYEIYRLMQKPIKNQRQKDACFQQIEDYWIKGMEEEFDDIININILQAIDCEEYIKFDRHLDAEEMKEKITQIKDILISPFLQYYQADGINLGISICCYNSSLNKNYGNFKDVINWLKDLESVYDEYYCSPYQLMFYRSFVGLSGHEVLEYLHGIDNTCMPSTGKAFGSYERFICDMGSSGKQVPRITPHTDQRWHNFQNMPDTNSDYQYQEELKIAMSFLYAYLTGHILPSQPNGYKFSLNSVCHDMKRLDDCFNYLFQNAFWANIFLEKLGNDLQTSRRGVTENPMANRFLFELVMQYNRELRKEEIDQYKIRLMIETVYKFVCLCVDGADETEKKENSRNQMRAEKDKFIASIEAAATVAPGSNFQDYTEKDTSLKDAINRYFIEQGI